MRRLKGLLPERKKPLLLSGVLLALAHPPFHLLVPSFVALVPFALWLAELPPGPDGVRQARRGGYLLGLVYFTLVFYWLLVALIYYTTWAIPAFLAPVLIMSGFLAVATWGMHRAFHGLRWRMWITLPVFWTAMEWFRSNLPQVGFPWMGLGDTLTGFPWLIGAADLVGTRGITFWLALVNGLIAALIIARRRAREKVFWTHPRELGIGLLIACLVPFGYSLARWTSLDLRPAATVGVVQPNIPEDIKLQRFIAIDSARVSVERLASSWTAGADPLDLVILPETVFPWFLDEVPEESIRSYQVEEWAAGLARELETPVLYGALGIDDHPGPGYDYFNSAFVVTPEGRREGSYDKRFLVPIVERVPFVDPAWFAGLSYFGGFGVGAWADPLEVAVAAEGAGGSSRFGVMICYESIFGSLGRHYRRAGADVLVNMTNDAWFGREVWWARSSALWQHPAHLVMRAVENRVGVARSANTGFSLVVDPLGRVSHRTELFEPDAFVADVMTTDARPLYVMTGDVIGWISALAVLIGAVLSWRLGRSKRAEGAG